MDIETLDKNFSVIRKIDEPDCVFHNVKSEPFEIHGLFEPKSKGAFTRMPQNVAVKINDGVSWLCGDTSGGRVRFMTNSKYLAVRVKMPFLTYPHQPLSCSCGIAVFIDGSKKSKYYKTFIPPTRFTDGWETLITFPDRKLRNITLWLPLYSHLDQLYVGVQKDAVLTKNSFRYRDILPVVFYGGSHVQGGCASVPSNLYQGFLSRWFNIDFINLSFSGSALGEKAMAEYIAKLPMSIFVMEYDHNAPSVEYLRKTHFDFYKTIRDVNSDIPIIMASKHDFHNLAYYVSEQQQNIDRRQVVIDTYNKALSMGDKNIYFIDGKTILGREDADCCTVDGVHPNDYGFHCIAKSYKKIFSKLLHINK